MPPCVHISFRRMQMQLLERSYAGLRLENQTTASGQKQRSRRHAYPSFIITSNLSSGCRIFQITPLLRLTASEQHRLNELCDWGDFHLHFCIKKALCSHSLATSTYFCDIIPILLSFLESQRCNYTPASVPDNLLKSFSVSLLFSHVSSPR